MLQPLLPLVVEPTELVRNLDAENLLIVDLCRPETYAQTHVPGAVRRSRSQYTVKFRDTAVADKNYIVSHLHDPNVVFVDARTPAEYRGETRRAERAGHIPGAVNFDWVNAIDQTRSLRLKPAQELKQVLSQMGVTPDKEVIAYCQTHHRSAHTYIVLKSLGYPRVRGYPSSWSEWGNSTETSIE